MPTHLIEELQYGLIRRYVPENMSVHFSIHTSTLTCQHAHVQAACLHHMHVHAYTRVDIEILRTCRYRYEPFGHELTVNYGGGMIRCHLGKETVTIGDLQVNTPCQTCPTCQKWIPDLQIKNQHFGQTFYANGMRTY